MTATTAEPLHALTAADLLPALRLVAAPVCEPPYDDELPPVPRRPTSPLGPLADLLPPLRLVPDLPHDEEPPAPRTPACDLPPAHPLARALVQGLLEVVAGVRPLAQLQPSTSVELYAALEQRLAALPRTTGSRPGTGAVRSVHVQQRDEGVAEVCATVDRGRRMGAVALRLEGVGGRWCLTELAGL